MYSQDLLGWKECRILLVKSGVLHANNSDGWMDKETLTYITAKWFLISLIFSLLFVDTGQVNFLVTNHIPPSPNYKFKLCNPFWLH